MNNKDDHVERFQEWLKRGPGEVYYGGILKAAAFSEKRRLAKRLSTSNLFPEIEADDEAALAKAKEIWEQGENSVRRGRARNKAIKNLLDADAGLKITDEDLKP